MWIVMSRGFAYGPFDSREAAGLWCVAERKADAQVVPLNEAARR